MRELRRGGLQRVEVVAEALPDGVAERLQAQRGVGRDAVAPADQIAVVAVDQADDPQPALPCGDLRQIGRPLLIGALGLDLAVVLAAWDAALRHEQALLAHHALGALAVHDAAGGARAV